jgi:hypothetical protein
MNWNMLRKIEGRFISRINFTDLFSGVPCLQRWMLGALARLVLSGCASVSPQRITTDRMDYVKVLADSWKRQTLLNVVRMSDDTDFVGKRIFTFLMILFSLAETFQAPAAPVVIVPSR